MDYVGKLTYLSGSDKWYVKDNWNQPIQIGGIKFFSTISHATAIIEGRGLTLRDREVWA